MKPTLQDAIKLAKTAHAGQVDKSGAPYFWHVQRVVDNVDGDGAKMVAVLHASREDTHLTADHLHKYGYPERIVTAIEGVTKRPNEEYMKFVQRAATNPLSRQVKIADLRDNMNLGRLRNPTDEDRMRRLKYKSALDAIQKLT